MPKPMSKPRKYQITPNSINPVEEASVKSVLDRFRNRAVSATGPEPVRDVVEFPVGSRNTLDIQSDEAEIAKQSDVGYPLDISDDSQTLEVLDSQVQEATFSNTSLLDIQSIATGNPNTDSLDIGNEKNGKPKTDDLARKLAEAENPAKTRAINIAKSETLASQIIPKAGKWKKYDKARSTETVFVRADAELVNQVKHFNVEFKLQMREFFELAAAAFMDANSKPKSGNLASNIALDDRGLKMQFFKTEKLIINLYEAYNQIYSPGSVWNFTDDKHGIRFNEIPIEIVEIGIMHCQTNKLDSDPACRINSFKYYAKQVDQYLMYVDYDPKMLKMMVETGRKRWREATGREVDLSFLEEGK